MKKNEKITLNTSLTKSIIEYCKLNNIDDISRFANQCLTQGFNIVKFGLSPKDNIERETKGINDFKPVEDIKEDNISKDKVKIRKIRIIKKDDKK